MRGGRFSLIYLLTIFIDVYSIRSFLAQYLKPEGGIETILTVLQDGFWRNGGVGSFIFDWGSFGKP